ncbi:P-loop containing nucleoside triphosphate hydrolase protein [Mycena galopus ATCC 62051]|nr:P-loop containing nucleoside triphosphate hydrolase protein [Mycena galopus ATCC 62051]
MSPAGSSSTGTSRAPHGRAGVQTRSSELSDTESAAVPHPDPDPDLAIGLHDQGNNSQILINHISGGQGGRGGGGGAHGGSGGTGHGPSFHYDITAETVHMVSHVDPSPAVVYTAQVLNHCPPPSRIFHGRQAILNAMHQFFAQDSHEQHIYVLYGLGGAGKTQIALRFIKESGCFTDKFLVDASSTETIETGFKAIATAKKIGNSLQDALKWLASRDQQWLLFFDNVDDPKLDLNKFFPKCNHGNIIITSRNPNLRVYGAHSQVSDMEEADAVALLLKSAAQETSLPNELLAAEIVQVLWYLPLAIVQAGAFILESGALDTYLALYSKNRARLLRDKPTLSHDDYAWTAYTTWQMSFDRLSPTAAKFLQLCSFLHQDGISEDIFSRAAYSLVQDQSEDKPKKLQKLQAKFRRLWSRSEISLKHNVKNPRKFLSWFLGPNREWDSASFVKVTKEIMAYSSQQRDSAASARTHRNYQLSIRAPSFVLNSPFPPSRPPSRLPRCTL